MTLAQRPAGRIIAAWSRWNCSTPRVRQLHSTVRLCPYVSNGPRALRSFSNITPRRQEPVAGSPSEQSVVEETKSEDRAIPLRQDDVQESKVVEEQSIQKNVSDTTEEQVTSGSLSVAEPIAGKKPGHKVKNVKEGPGTKAKGGSEISIKTKVRDFMSHVPASVAILTVHSIDSKTSEPLPVGIAVSSFNTVTLDPPHVSFNIKTPSMTMDAIRNDNGLFRVHFLSNTPRGAKIAENFTQGNSPKKMQQRMKNVQMTMPAPMDVGVESKDGSGVDVQARRNKSLAPRIDEEQVLATMECRLSQELRVADHVVVIAEVVEFKSSKTTSTTLLYLQRGFKTETAKEVSKFPGKKAGFHISSLPLFPGKPEVDQIVSRINNIVRNDPEILDGTASVAASLLRTRYGISTSICGISLPQILNNVRVKLGKPSSLGPDIAHLPAVRRFHGRLSAHDIAAVLESAKSLVRENPTVLQRAYADVLMLLDVHSASEGMLASDILTALREEGLAEPYDAQIDKHKTMKVRKGAADMRVNIYNVEEAEHRLRSLFKSMPYAKSWNKDVLELVQAIGATPRFGNSVVQMRDRILTETHPSLFSPAECDFQGHVTPPEISIIINRLINHLGNRDHNTSAPWSFKKKLLRASRIELLRQIRVHPMISGLNLDFIMLKLTFARTRLGANPSPRDIAKVLFAGQITDGPFDWTVLQQRLRKLARSHTLQVTKWSSEDLLVAAGFFFNPVFMYQKDEAPALVEQDLQGMLLDRELKQMFNDSQTTDEQKAIIAVHFKEKHDHNVLEPAKKAERSEKEAAFLDALTTTYRWRSIKVRSHGKPSGFLWEGKF